MNIPRHQFVNRCFSYVFFIFLVCIGNTFLPQDSGTLSKRNIDSAVAKLIEKNQDSKDRAMELLRDENKSKGSGLFDLF